MRQHLTIVAVLHVLLSAFGLFTGMVVLLSSVAAGALVGVGGSGLAGLVAGTVGSIVAIVLIGLALPGLALAWGVHRRREWARPLGLVLGVLHLVNIPFGTAIGIYTIWVMLQPETESLLAEGRAARVA